MFVITNEEFLNQVAGGDGDDDGGDESHSEHGEKSTRAASSDRGNNDQRNQAPANTSQAPASEYLACGLAIAKANASPTWPNVIAAAWTCKNVAREVLDPTTLAPNPNKPKYNPYRADQE